MWQKPVAILVMIALPAAASAGPLAEAVEKAARNAASAQGETRTRSRARLWTGIALLAGGGVMTTLGSLELGDDETGPDDGEDLNDSDDGEDADGWGNKALLGGGIASAALGSVLLLTGRKSGPALTVGRGAFNVRHTIRF